jgi:hypothetical protein
MMLITEKTHMSEELSSEVAAEEVGNAADGAAGQRPAEERKRIVTNLQQFAVVLEGEASTLTSALSIRSSRRLLGAAASPDACWATL